MNPADSEYLAAWSFDCHFSDLSDALAGLSKLIISLYEYYIKMDKQDDLDGVKAHKLLLAMDNIRKDWVEIIYIPHD